MFSQFEPNVKATTAFLKLLKVKVNNATVNETLQNHPDWPSLLCISDSFNKWNITNAAGKMEPGKIDELPTPFIAYISNREFPLAIVTQVKDREIELYAKNYNKPLTKNKEDFLKDWTGVYLIAETTEHSGEKGYVLNKRKALIDPFIPAALIILLSVISFLFVYRTVNDSFNIGIIHSGAIYLQYFLLLSGVVVTSLLLWYEVDKNNPVLKKVCTGISKGSCNAILTGKQSKVFAWLSWSEVGFFFFAGSLLLLLFAGIGLPGTLVHIAFLNLLALPYTIFSIYYQWRVAKQWCVLCLAVQALLLLGGINVLANNFITAPYELSIQLLSQSILLYLLPVLLWYAVKPYLLRLQEAKNTKREYLRIKFNAEIFETLLKKQKAITLPVYGLGIDIGNPGATNSIIKICNPYCGPCASAHLKIDRLLEDIPNLNVKIIFTTPNQPQQDAYKPVSHLLAIEEKANNERVMKTALDDWYLSDKKDYALFAAKHPMNGELTKQGEKIEAMDKWCKAMDVRATPTIFLNGYQLPDAYSIEDLQYFLLE